MKINLQLLANAVTDDIINAVINGKYGNGQARKTALANAGYDYSAVQAAVNAKLSGKSTTTPSATAPTTPATTTPANVNNGFTYKDYMESDAVKKAQAALDAHNAGKPLDYQSKYGSLAEEAANAWANRDKFTYDLNGDALYQQYKDKYINQGRLAMQDTIGQASAMTGGYGNSYAATAGNQAYQASLQNLNDIVPQLYQMAYDQYNQEGQDMLNKYNLYNTMENQEYSRYRDTVSDWTSQRDYLANAYNNERTYDRSIYDSDKNFAYGTWSDDRNYNYKVERDRIADEQWQKTFDESIRQYNETMAYKKSQRSSGSGGKTPIKQPTSDDFNTVMKNAANYEGNNEALDMYLLRAEQDGKITKEEGNRIYDMYSIAEEDTPPKGGIAARAGLLAGGIAAAKSGVEAGVGAIAGGITNAIKKIFPN
jgi:hypothetical protein